MYLCLAKSINAGWTVHLSFARFYLFGHDAHHRMITMCLRQLRCGLCPACRVYVPTKRDHLNHAWAGSNYVPLVSVWTSFVIL